MCFHLYNILETADLWKWRTDWWFRGRGEAGREVGVVGKGTRGTIVVLELLSISGGGSSGLHRLKRKRISRSHSHTPTKSKQSGESE